MKVLQSLGTSLLLGKVLEPRTGYEESNLQSLGLIVVQLAGQAEVAAEWLVEENATLRALFRDVTAFVSDPELAGEIARAGHAFDSGLRLSVLRNANDELRGLLIRLHAYAEDQESEEASRFEEAIWAELRRSTERRSSG